MSLSRQLRRAAERTQQKQEQKSLKNSGPDSIAASNLEISEPAETDAPEPQTNRTGATGPRTLEGKAISSLNNLKHGLAGAFRVLKFESQSDFTTAHEALIAEHQPTTPTESELVRRIAEHAWLSRRAQDLVDKAVLDCNAALLSIFMRYQTTNERGFRACLNDLFRLRREQRAANRDSESQNREAEIHEARVRLANAQAAHLELDNNIRSTVDAPIPGYCSVPLEQVKGLFKTAMLSLKYDGGAKTAA